MIVAIGPLALASPDLLVPQYDAKTSNFWSMDTARQTPFDYELVTSKVDGDYKTDQFYISSKPLADCAADRVLCTYSRLVSDPGPHPAYIDVDSGHAPAAVAMEAQQLKCAVLDVEWRANALPTRTKWAKPTRDWGVEPNPTACFAYSMTMAVRRVVDYLCEQPEIDKQRIALGGWFSLLIAGVDDRIASVYNLFGSGGQAQDHGWHLIGVRTMPKDQQDIWVAHFDPFTYATSLKGSILFVISSNDYSFWSGDAVRNYEAVKSVKRLLIVQNKNHGLDGFGVRSPQVGPLWLASTIGGDPPYPSISDPVP